MREIRADFAEHDREVEFDLAANVTVTDPPFGDGPVLGHIDTTGPTLTIDEGHLDDADFGLEVPYDIAKQLFVDRDPTQVMPALMGGEVQAHRRLVEGAGDGVAHRARRRAVRPGSTPSPTTPTSRSTSYARSSTDRRDHRALDESPATSRDASAASSGGWR